MKLVYKYTESGEYDGEELTQENPEKAGDYLMPARTTELEPLSSKEGVAIVWDGVAWVYVEDHRQVMDERGCIVEGSGTPYWFEGDNPDSQPRYMMGLGVLPDGALLVAPRPLVWVKDRKIKEIMAERDRLEQSPASVGDMVFDADVLSHQRVQAAYARIVGTGAVIDWTLSDNVIVSVDEAVLKAVLDAVVDRANVVFVRARRLKDAVLESDDVLFVENLSWDSDLII